MSKPGVKLFRLRDDGREVLIHEPPMGIKVVRDGNRIRIENKSATPLTLSGTRRPVKPRQHATVQGGVKILVNGESIIAR
jgi:hypothetical protein